MDNRLMIRTLIAAAATLAFMGCTSGTSTAPTVNPVTGQHPANWKTNHWSAYLQNPDSCTACHGSTTDATASNPAAPSCFTCHPNGPHHPANWNSDPNVPAHGLAAMGAAGAAFNAAAPSFPMQGFNSCTPCHAQTNAATGNPDFTNPLGITPSCLASGCHSNAAPFAPHALVSNTINSYLWGAGTGTGAKMPNHDQVDVSNVGTCVLCHAYSSTTANPNNPISPVAPATPGTQPGCYNGTLCHSGSF